MIAVLFGLVGPRGVVLGFLMPITIVALVAYGVFELIRSRDGATPAAAGPGWSGSTVAAPPAGSALAILDERFARGEIDAEEYVQRRNLLAPPGPTWTGPAPSTPAAPDGAASDVTPTEQPTTEQPVTADAAPGAERTDTD